MQSPYNFIVSPVGGKYITSKNIDDTAIYVNSSIEDAKYVNRTAVVVSIPKIYKGDIKKGDIIIIHHNIFRDYYNTKGNISTSPNYLFDDLFLVAPDLVYMYKSKDGWLANNNYCFIRPIKEINNLSKIEILAELKGEVIYSNEFKKHSIVGFLPESEYEFEIDGETLYRMRSSDICLIK